MQKIDGILNSYPRTGTMYPTEVPVVSVRGTSMVTVALSGTESYYYECQLWAGSRFMHD